MRKKVILMALITLGVVWPLFVFAKRLVGLAGVSQNESPVIHLALLLLSCAIVTICALVVAILFGCLCILAIRIIDNFKNSRRKLYGTLPQERLLPTPAQVESRIEQARAANDSDELQAAVDSAELMYENAKARGLSETKDYELAVPR